MDDSRSESIMLLLLLSLGGLAQPDKFPESWIGDWKGELQWYAGAAKEPTKVNMELKIHATDSSNRFAWQIIYGSLTDDNRSYTLKLEDTATSHWVIDEKNGIILDQYFIANKLCGAFTVENSTIINSYQLENDKIIIEFYSLSSKPLGTSGFGGTDSPKVDSYKMNSYQKAILTRMK